ncbi:MAG: hypothetical protein L3K23_08155 [Thermoplasmata archaeon]|nr:hypothetical protein [Thermoplasmata archaeon]
MGTNGRVFWSDKQHVLGVVGDEVLISRAIVRTSYLPGILCRDCGFVGFLHGSGDADDAEAIVDDAMGAPEDPLRPAED